MDQIRVAIWSTSTPDHWNILVRNASLLRSEFRCANFEGASLRSCLRPGAVEGQRRIPLRPALRTLAMSVHLPSPAWWSARPAIYASSPREERVFHTTLRVQSHEGLYG